MQYSPQRKLIVIRIRDCSPGQRSAPFFPMKDGAVRWKLADMISASGYSYTEIAGIVAAAMKVRLWARLSWSGHRVCICRQHFRRTFRGTSWTVSLWVRNGFRRRWQDFSGPPSRNFILKVRKIIPAPASSKNAPELSGAPVERKLRELDEVVAKCAGLSIEAATTRPYARCGAQVPIQVQVTNRSPVHSGWRGGHPGRPSDGGGRFPDNIPVRRVVGWTVQEPIPMAQFRFRIGAEPILITRPILYRYVDKILGDRAQPFAVVPPVSMRFG